MTIKIQCQCSRVITVSEQLAGQPTRCPSCGRRHIVPAVKPAPRTLELSESTCRDCASTLAKDAAFCHCCGLPAAPVVTERRDGFAAAMKRHWDAAKKAEAEAAAAPPPPQAVTAGIAPPPQPVPQNYQQAQQAAAMNAAPPIVPSLPGPFAGPNAAAIREAVGPFVRAVANQQRPVSGLGRIAMTCVYMAMFLGIFSVIFALPLLGGISCNGSEISVAQHQSLLKLLQGMGALTMLFTFVGLLTGFLGMFHFGRRRGNAVAGLFLSILLGIFAVTGVGKVRHEIAKLNGKVSNSPACPVKNGCDFRARFKFESKPAIVAPAVEPQQAPKSAPAPSENAQPQDSDLEEF